MSTIESRRLREVFNNAKQRHILVIGDIILDQFVWGRVERISPEAPVPVVEVTREEFRLGGAANVVNNIISLGGRATLVGLVGDDPYKDRLVQLLQARGISHEGLITCQRPTTVKTRVIAHHQQVIRFDREDSSPMSRAAIRRLREFVLDLKDHWDGLIISDYRKGVVCPALMKTIKEEFLSKGAFVVVDPKMGNFPLYRGVSAVTPNLKEASEGARMKIKDLKSLILAGQRLKKRLQCRCVLITRGEEGMSLFVDKQVKHIPTVARDVFDVTGAGDTVVAAFSLFHLAGATFEEAATLANVAAGVVVGKVGTAVTSQKEIKKFLKEVQQ